MKKEKAVIGQGSGVKKEKASGLAQFVLFQLGSATTSQAPWEHPHHDSPPAELRMLLRALLAVLGSAAADLSFARLGPFGISWDAEEPFVAVTSPEGRLLFRTLRHWPFLTVGYAACSRPPIESGNFKVNEWVLYETPYRAFIPSLSLVMIDLESIRSVTILEDSMIFRGELWGLVTLVRYSLVFSLDRDRPQLLRFLVDTEPVIGSFNRIFLNYWCETEELFFGLGVQYSHFNMKGRRVPVLVAEQGIGRGAEPLTSLLNLVGDGSGGYWHTTYAPKPLYISSFNRSIVLTNAEVDLPLPFDN